MKNGEILTRVRSLAADRRNPLSVPCWLCGRPAGVPCAEMPGYSTKVRDDGHHPLRERDAIDTADRNVCKLLATIGDTQP